MAEGGRRVERFSWGDAAELAGDVGPDPRLIGVLTELDRPIDVDRLRERALRCVADHTILRRRFVRNGRATWRASWEVVSVSIEAHVAEVVVDDALHAAERLLLSKLPESLPMWRLVLLRTSTTTHLLFVAHHAVLDGTTAMAVLGSLLDVRPATAPGSPRRRNPLLSPLGLVAGFAPGASRSSLLVPIRSGFAIRAVTVGLDAARTAARRSGATVNDLILLAVGESLRAVAAARGERLRRVVVSVPVAGQPQPRNRLGRNQVGAFVVAVPPHLPAEPDDRLLARMASRTRPRKLLARGWSGPPALSVVLAVLGFLGWYRPLFERQRAITTLLTNLRGPERPVDICGARVVSLTPISPALGNVTVVFAAVSYAGTLRVTARLDGSVQPETELLMTTLQASLDRLARPHHGPGGPPGGEVR